MYEKTLIAGWGDMDFDSHIRNTAYLDKSADVRIMYFADSGFPMSDSVAAQLGPVVMKDEVKYYPRSSPARSRCASRCRWPACRKMAAA